jgi:large subunit ribosomal protein L19
MNLHQYVTDQVTAKTQRPALKAGDTVKVETKITEGDKTRLQAFEGIVLGIRGAGASKTFTVRREAGGFAVERIFPLYSPLITKIDILKRQKVRRAKLTYLRQAGRRKVKEDLLAMQRHRQEEADKKRLADAAAAASAKEAEEKAEAEKEKASAEKQAEKTEAPKAEKKEKGK